MVTIMRIAARELRDVFRAATPVHRALRDRVILVVVVTVVIDLVCAALALLFERHAKGTEIESFGSALFWSSTQLLTVSSQLRNPISAPARVLDVLMEAYAISVVATLAGSFGTFFHVRGHERAEARRRAEAASGTASA